MIEWVDLAWNLDTQIVHHHLLIEGLGLDECVEVLHSHTSFNSSTMAAW